MMIDWVTAAIPLAHTDFIRGGRFISITQDGEVEYESNRFLQVEGSHSSKIQIVSLHNGPEGEIRFSGNPVKFLQGHNLFGITDVVSLMTETMRRVYRILGIIPTAENWRALEEGRYTLSRVDVTSMQELSTRGDVLTWIRAAANASRSRHKSAGVLKGDTLYWGQKSRRWAIKVYSKGQEVNAYGHELPEDILHRQKLIDWADNKLRLELVLRSPELKKLGLREARAFANVDAEHVLRSYLDKIIMPENFSLSTEAFEALPRTVRSSYLLWKHGEDLREALSKNTYYKHRRILLEQGIDISVLQKKEQSNVVPLVRVLEAVPARVPDFAIGTELYWQKQ